MYVLFEVGVVEGSDGWMMEDDSFQRREGGISIEYVRYRVHSHRKIARFISISFTMAVGPVLLVLTYTVM